MWKPKIPRTRRSQIIVPDEVQELKLRSALNVDGNVDVTSADWHVPDGLVCSEQQAVTLSVSSKDVNGAYNDELECAATIEAPVTSQLPAKIQDGVELSATYTYSAYEAIFTVICILSYVFDVGSDIYVAFVYYSDGDLWWFILTIIFIIIPSLTITLFSFLWYIQDGGCKSYSVVWLPRLVMLFLQLAPLLRYVDTMIFGVRSRSKQRKDKQSYWYRLKMYEETDSALLRLFECFMEAAPQLTLQVYIVLTHGFKHNLLLSIGQIISCTTSLGSISWALVAYHRALRLSLPDKAKLDWWCVLIVFLWRIFVIGPRVLAFAAFAACTHYSLFVLCGIHWVVMFVWILIQRTTFCPSRLQEYCFNAVIAFVCIFDFFNLLEGRTRIRYLIYYTLVYCENLVMIAAWYFYRAASVEWYCVPVIVSVVGLFWVGILLQIMYYLVFHPNNKLPFANEKRIKVCVPLSELCDCGCDDSSTVAVDV